MPGHKIKVGTATAVVIANMIGTGVFTGLGFQIKMGISTGFSILMLWLIGGIVALCGALCYGELASAFPRSGGEYTYLSKVIHPLAGFISGWVSVTVGFAAPVALSAISFGQYLSRVFPAVDVTVAACCILVFMTIIHSFHLKQSAGFQNVFTLIEIALILVFVFMGFNTAHHEQVTFLPHLIQGKDWETLFSSSFAISLIYVSYAYSGWNVATYISDEIENQRSNVGRALAIGTIIVGILYIFLNVVFLYSSPAIELSGKMEVGYVSAIRIFGSQIGNLMGLMICLLLTASVSSMVFTGPRIAKVMGEDLPQLRFLSLTNKHNIPVLAILTQSAITMILILTSSFQKVLLYTGFTLSLSTSLTVVCLFIMRFRMPELKREFRTPGYPVTPILFLLVSSWTLVYTFIGYPFQSIGGFITILAGGIIYFIKKPALEKNAL